MLASLPIGLNNTQFRLRVDLIKPVGATDSVLGTKFLLLRNFVSTSQSKVKSVQSLI